MSALINLRKTIYYVLYAAFFVLVLYILVISIPAMIKWPTVIALIYLLALYSILYPIALPLIPTNIAYYAYIPASFFGLEVSIIFWLSRYAMLEPSILLVSCVIAVCLLYLVHHVTKRGIMIHREFLYGGLGLDLKRITRLGSTVIAPFFIVMSTAFSNQVLMEVPSLSLLIVVSLLIALYAIFSILGLNITYRSKLLNESLGAKDFASKLNSLETRLLKKYPQKRLTIRFFFFVLRSAVDDFIYGDYERSFLDSYRLIWDKIIRSPSQIVKRKVDKKSLEEYRKIRVFLVHGYLWETKSKLELPIKVEDVVWARKVLFQKTLNLINLAFHVADII